MLPNCYKIRKRDPQCIITMFSLCLLSLPSLAMAILDMNCTSGGVYAPNAVSCSNVYTDATCGLIFLNNSAVIPGGSDERPSPCFNVSLGGFLSLYQTDYPCSY